MHSKAPARSTSGTKAVEPIAVVSVGCRLPGGVRDLTQLGEALHDGAGVLLPIPADRWGEEFHDPTLVRKGTTSCHVGAFLDDIQRFDAEFFGISPREAREMDPQQRILLEVAWETLHGSGRPQEWGGTRTGVFAGILASDYLVLHSKTRGTEGIDPFYATGKEFSFGAGRIAYNFDLQGPVMTVTTACSSSLLAVHLACQSLRADECDAALAGGVNILLAPELTVFMSRVNAVSPTGRCAPFSANADGVVRGEGCALVLLKRLADAQRDGDEIFAVINGSAVNHDGHSAGLTVPSATAQARLIRQALSSSGIDPEEVGYVEAHATGTPLGDPIELAALDEVFDRAADTDTPLLVGSHKAVFGHLDSAAGILGLLKAIIVVRDGIVPPQPAIDKLTPNFAWSSSGLRVATRTNQLKTTGDGPRRAGVSAFGLSGTNVHVLLSQPPVASGSSSAATERADDPGSVLFVFTGEQPLPTDAVMELYASEPAFRAALTECDQMFSADATWSLIDLLRNGSAERLARPDLGAPCLFAIQIALAELLRAKGIQPAAVLGQSLGEIAAATVSGALDIRAAARLVLRRGAVLAALPARSTLIVDGPPQLVQDLLSTHSPDLATASISGPGRTEFTGLSATIDAAVADLREVGATYTVRPGHQVYGYPGPQIAEAADELATALAGEPASAMSATPGIAFLSTVLPGQAPVLDARYWARNLTEPVQLWAALEPALQAQRHDILEIGPQSDLANTLALLAPGVRVLPSLIDGVSPLQTLHELAADLGRASTVSPIRPRPRDWGGDAHWLEGVRPGAQGRSQSPDSRAPAAGVTPPVVGSAIVRDRVNDAVREVLGLDNGKPVPAQRPLLEQGLTSITAVELASRLAEDFGTEPDLTLVYLCPRVEDLVEHFAKVGVASHLETPADAEPASAVIEKIAITETPAVPELMSAVTRTPTAQPASSASAGQVPSESGALAIVGMACRVPGADTLDAFWTLMCDSAVQVTDIPEHRRLRDGWSELLAEVPSRGGYLENIEGFDAAFFKISPIEAARIDPQQRLFLEVAWEALADAGIVVGTTLAGRTGVYVGMDTTDYQRRFTRASEVDAHYGTGNCFAGTPGRLAYALNLRGPSLAVDTACSSSLTAVHLARQALLAGDCDAAVVGGVNIISGPTVSISMSHGGALASDGRCKTFTDSADGYGRGEGAGVIVVKRLDRALADGDRIYATVLGSAINSDGASGGFTVPNPAAQTAVVSAALASAGIDPSDIGYVEAHGTGTPLGDPIELKGLSSALGSDPVSAPYIGSVKSLIGHLEAAAGITGLIKAALAVNRSQIPPHALFGARPAKVDWQALGLRLNERTVDWPQRPIRLAGVSAFGFTGSNAHVILGQAPTEPARANARLATGTALVVSADTPAALRQHATQLAEVIAAGAPISDLAYTLARRRSTHRYRAVVIADSPFAAGQSLTELASGRPHPGVVYGSRAVTEPSLVHLWFGEDAHLEADWAYLPDELRLSANRATAEFDSLTLMSHDTTTSQRQRLAGLRSQVGWSTVWRDLGIQVSHATGAGVGAHAAAWYRGEIDLTVALARTLHASHAEDLEAERAAATDREEDAVRIDAVPRSVRSAIAWNYVQAQAFVVGYPVDWFGVIPETGQMIALPAYPWQRRDFWFTSDIAGTPESPAAHNTSTPAAHLVAKDAARAADELPDERFGAVRDLLFTHDWQPAEAESLTDGSGRWLVFADQDAPLASVLASRLSAAGYNTRSISIPGRNSQDWTTAIAEACSAGPLAGVVLIVCDRPDAAELTMCFGQTVQRFPGALGSAHLITRDAHPLDARSAPNPAQAAAWAVGSVLATELSHRWGRLIDVVEGVEPTAVASALVSAQADDQLRLDGHTWLARRLHRQLCMPDPVVANWDAELTFAVHGPDAATVEPILCWLASRGAGSALVHLGAESKLDLGDTRISVDVIADSADWVGQIAALKAGGTLGAVVHHGPVQDAPVTVRDSDTTQHTQAEAADQLLEAVIEAVAAVSDTTAGSDTAVPVGEEKNLFLLITDAAGDWGAVGAAVSAARSARSRAVLRSSPMPDSRPRVVSFLPRDHSKSDATTSVIQAESGIGQLSAEQVMSVLDFAASAPEGTDLSAGVVDVERYVNVCQRLAPRALLDELDDNVRTGQSESPLGAELRALSPVRLAERLLDLVLQATAAVLGLSVLEIDPEIGFFDLGMDSMLAVALKTRLENDTQTQLPATLTFELPTPRKVARHLVGLLEPAATGSDPAFARHPDTAARATEATEATDDELLQLLAQATVSARDLLKEASQWS